MARAIIYSWPYMLDKNHPHYKIWSIWKRGDALLNVCKDGWLYVAPFFTRKSLCGILRTNLISPASSLWYLDQSYILSGYYNEEKTGTNNEYYVSVCNSMSGVCRKVIVQWYSTEAEDELQVIPCLGFYTWAHSAHRSSVSERYFDCRSSAVLLHKCLLKLCRRSTTFQPQNAEKKLYKT